MPTTFPNNPSLNQISTQNGRSYKWSGYSWDLVNNVANHTHIIGDVSGLQTVLNNCLVAQWTPNMSADIVMVSGNKFIRNVGTGWDAQVYSTERYDNNVYCSAKASQTDGYTMFGLNPDPTTDASYGSIDYAWHTTPTNAYIYESSVSLVDTGPYTTSTVFSITYDGQTIIYWKDGIRQRTVSRAIGSPLYFDSSIYSNGSAIDSVEFGTLPHTISTNIIDFNSSVSGLMPNILHPFLLGGM